MPESHRHPSKDPMVRFAQEMKLRNFSEKTITSYLYYNNELLRFASKFADDITTQDIKDYLAWLRDSGRATATINLAINAIKLYYGVIMKRKFFNNGFGVVRPKQEKYLPTVLAKSEIMRMIETTGSLKHKLMIQVLYTTGLRVSELRNLDIGQIDFERKTVFVRDGKGGKDRITTISQAVLMNIGRYLREYQPLRYLFENHESGQRLSVRTFQQVVSDAAANAGIRKQVSAHTLRHSFATHLLENNVNLRYIQSMLGHARLDTTQIYTRVAAVKLREIGDLI